MYFPEANQHAIAQGVTKVVRLFSAASKQDKPVHDTPVVPTKPATPFVITKKAVPRRHDFSITLRTMRGASRTDDE